MCCSVINFIMCQKLVYRFGFLIAGLWALSLAQRRVTFNDLKCDIKSKKMKNIICFLENTTTFTVEGTIGNKDLGNLIGFLELDLYHYSDTVKKMSGGRLDMCGMLAARTRPSLLTFLYDGIRQAENNLPQKCPFKRNVKYILRHLKFDPSNVPMFLPDYNFTFTVKFFGNNGNLFDLRVWGSFCQIGNEICLGKKNN